mgnify:CR=1 FL=1
MSPTEASLEKLEADVAFNEKTLSDLSDMVVAQGREIEKLRADYPFLDQFWAVRLIRAYGTEAWDMLGTAKSATDLGRDFGATLTEAEVRWQMDREFAREAEDIVWRRTKLGLRMSAEQITALRDWIGAHGDAADAAAAAE